MEVIDQEKTERMSSPNSTDPLYRITRFDALGRFAGLPDLHWPTDRLISVEVEAQRRCLRVGA